MSWANDMGFDGYDLDGGFSTSNKGDDTWTTKDGEVIEIKNMSDKHLFNAYRKFNDHTLAREMLLRLFAKSAEVLK